MNKPPVAIVIVSWNSLSFLKTCLDSVKGQVYQPITLVVIDNASRDGTQEWISTNYPEILFKSFDKNRGFAAAVNKGIQITDAPFILLVNPDVVLQPDCLVHLVNAILDNPKIGIVAAKLLRADNQQLLDSTGLFINRSRCPYDRGQGEPDTGQYEDSRIVFGACGALALYRRKMLEDIAVNNEYFDEDFFAYYEDVDLAWRAQLYGWQAVYEPLAVASHVRGWGDSLRKQRKKDASAPRLALRNRYLMLVKNDRLVNFMRDFPAILASELPRLVYSAIRMPAVLLGIVDFFTLYPKIAQKRRYIWNNEVVKGTNIRPWLM